MEARIDSQALDEFNEHLSELSKTWYDVAKRQVVSESPRPVRVDGAA